MSNSIYSINKGINRAIEFKGLKAQYIWYLGGGILGLMFLYGIMYLTGLPSVVCLVVIGIAGSVTVIKVYALSNKYGEYGLMKAMAKRSVPKVVSCRTRSVFRILRKGGK